MIDETELEIGIVYPSSYDRMNHGAPESLVRVTHIPTGLTVISGAEPTKMQNKKLALRGLEAMLTGEDA